MFPGNLDAFPSSWGLTVDEQGIAMGLYEDRIANHAVRGSIDLALSTLESIPPSVRGQQQQSWDRCVATLSYLRERLNDRTLAGLVSDSFLSNANSWVTQMQQEAQNAVNTGNATHLANAGGQAENIAQNLGQFPAATDPTTFQRLLDEAHVKVNTIHEQVIAAGATIRSHEQTMRADVDAARETSSTLIEEMRSQRKHSERLLLEMAKDVTSTDFLAAAQEEGKAADTWRGYTIVGAVITGVVTIVLALMSVGDKLERVGAHAAISATLVLVVVYLGRQSALHRAQQHRARTLGLQIASIGPFLLGLKDDQHADVLKILADRFFTGDQQAAATGKNDGYPTTQELVRTIISMGMGKGK